MGKSRCNGCIRNDVGHWIEDIFGWVLVAAVVEIIVTVIIGASQEEFFRKVCDGLIAIFLGRSRIVHRAISRDRNPIGVKRNLPVGARAGGGGKRDDKNGDSSFHASYLCTNGSRKPPIRAIAGVTPMAPPKPKGGMSR